MLQSPPASPPPNPKQVSADAQLAMRLIDSAKGLTDKPEVIALLDTARWSMAWMMSTLDAARAAIALGATAGEDGLDDMTDAIRDATRSYVAQHRRASDSLTPQDIMAVSLSMLERVTQAAASRAAGIPSTRRRRRGCGACSGASGCASGAGLIEFKREYLGGFVRVPTGEPDDPTAPVPVSFDYEHLRVGLDEAGRIAVIHVPAEHLDLATARVHFLRQGSLLANLHLTVEGTAPGGVRFALRERLESSFFILTMRGEPSPYAAPEVATDPAARRSALAMQHAFVVDVRLARSDDGKTLDVQLLWDVSHQGSVSLDQAPPAEPPAAPIAPVEAAAEVPVTGRPALVTPLPGEERGGPGGAGPR